MSQVKYTYDINKTEFRENELSYLHPDMQETMWAAIPLDLANTKYVENIHRVSSMELERISAALDVVKRNAFVAVADSNGLKAWEQYTALPPEIIEITDELRRSYLQVKMTGRNYFLGKHFTVGLELIGGPIRQIYYDPDNVEARILFKEPLTDPQLAKIEYFCAKVGPAHIRWAADSPGAGSGWVSSSYSEYSAPWLRSDPEQESIYLHTSWTQLTPDQRQDYVEAARDDFNLMSDDEKIEIYGTTDEPDWMGIDWVNSPPIDFTDDHAPPRYGEYI